MHIIFKKNEIIKVLPHQCLFYLLFFPEFSSGVCGRRPWIRVYLPWVRWSSQPHTKPKYSFHIIWNNNFVRVRDILTFFNRFLLQFKPNFWKLMWPNSYHGCNFATANNILGKQLGVKRLLLYLIYCLFPIKTKKRPGLRSR